MKRALIAAIVAFASGSSFVARAQSAEPMPSSPMPTVAPSSELVAAPPPTAYDATSTIGSTSDSEPRVVPTLALGLGGFFPLTPSSDAHLVGSALVGLSAQVGESDGARISILGELGYSGDRRGYLAGRHFVIGTGLRYGNLFGSSLLFQAALGRTGGERSFGLRTGVRFDIHNYVGVTVLYEGRHVNGVDADLVARGVRFELFFDPLRFIYGIHRLNRL